VRAGEPEEQLVERLAIGGGEPGEELVLDLLRDRAQTPELPLSRRRDADSVPAPVVRVALARDEAAALERVEQRDEATGVERERPRDGRLRLSGALGEEREDAVLVRLDPSCSSRSTALVLNASPSRARRKPLLATSSLASRSTGGKGASAARGSTGIIVSPQRSPLKSWQKATIGGCKG
jgi:hypothetical protein